jgi:hypothetical protein
VGINVKNGRFSRYPTQSFGSFFPAKYNSATAIRYGRMRPMVVVRRKKPAKRTGTKPGKERILDAAERLFARDGFYGISVRDITEEAGVDVALVSYHFGGKRELFTAVFQPRAVCPCGRRRHSGFEAGPGGDCRQVSEAPLTPSGSVAEAGSFEVRVGSAAGCWSHYRRLSGSEIS